MSALRRGITDYQIADETHSFPEWVKNQPPEGSKRDISLHDILSALGMAEYEQKLAEEQQAEAEFDEALTIVRGT